MNIDNCLECFCLKFKRPTHSNQTEKEGEIRGVGFITLPCSRSYTEIDGGHNDFSAKKRKRKAERLFELKGRGGRHREAGRAGGEEGGVLGGARGRR